MIINKFKGKGVHDFLDFDIQFNKDVNFLVGGNGAGKTTALKLINALITPDLKELCMTNFQKIEVHLNFNKTDYVIECERVINKESHAYPRDKVLKIREVGITTYEENSDILQGIYIPDLSLETTELEVYENNWRKFNEVIDDVILKSANTPDFVTIEKITSPVYLGLERKQRINQVDSFNEYYKERNRIVHNRVTTPRQRLINGTLGVSLMETEFLIQSEYRSLRYREEVLAKKLRDGILMSAFKYTELDFNVSEYFNSQFRSDKNKILGREAEIKEALESAGILNKTLDNTVGEFFKKIEMALQKHTDFKSRNIDIEFLINKNQIDLITRIVDIIDNHKDNMDKLFLPINNFLDILNSFYKDTRKKIKMDTVGHLLVEKPNGKNSLVDALSSGERQLLVMFGNIFFSKKKLRDQPVFIIDEPELSLHIRWQEMLVKKIIDSNTGAQFIFATHSPDIIGELKSKNIKCR